MAIGNLHSDPSRHNRNGLSTNIPSDQMSISNCLLENITSHRLMNINVLLPVFNGVIQLACLHKSRQCFLIINALCLVALTINKMSSVSTMHIFCLSCLVSSVSHDHLALDYMASSKTTTNTSSYPRFLLMALHLVLLLRLLLTHMQLKLRWRPNRSMHRLRPPSHFRSHTRKPKPPTSGIHRQGQLGELLNNDRLRIKDPVILNPNQKCTTKTGVTMRMRARTR